MTRALQLKITPKPPIPLDERDIADHAFELNEEQLQWMEKHNRRARPGPRKVRPQPIDEVELTNRVEWRNKTPKVICFGCCERGHIFPEFKLGITSLSKIVANYENLSTDENTRVSDTNFNGFVSDDKRTTLVLARK